MLQSIGSQRVRHASVTKQLFLRFFSLIGYYKMLSIVLCAIYSRSLLVIYFMYCTKEFGINIYTVLYSSPLRGNIIDRFW